jgi:hypothetical protein
MDTCHTSQEQVWTSLEMIFHLFFSILVGQIICLVEHSIIVSQLIIPPPSPEPMIW